MTRLSPALGSKPPAAHQAVYLAAFLYPMSQPPAFLTVSAQSQDFHREIYKKNEPSRGRSSDGSCAIAHRKSAYIMGLYNDQLASSLLARDHNRCRFLCDQRRRLLALFDLAAPDGSDETIFQSLRSRPEIITRWPGARYLRVQCEL
jgi:hypothetical protein